MTNTLTTLRGIYAALDCCLDDSRAVVADCEEKLGKRYRPKHHAALVKTVADGETALAELANLIASMEAQEPWHFQFDNWNCTWGVVSPEEYNSLKDDDNRMKLYEHPAQPSEPLQNHTDMYQAMDAVEWAVGKWVAEVQNRPLVNVHRRSLDDTWRTVIRHFGGDDSKLLPLKRHDDLWMADRENSRANVSTAQPSEPTPEEHRCGGPGCDGKCCVPVEEKAEPKRPENCGTGHCSCIECIMEPKAEPYDQQSLELCETCGWKTLIPGDGCLNCERAPKAEPMRERKHSAVDFLPHDDHLRFVQRVLEGDAPREDRDDAAQMVRDMRLSIYRSAAPQAKAVQIADTPEAEPVQEPVKITGATLRKLHDEMEPLAAMENEEQVSAWWKHFAGRVRLEVRSTATAPQARKPLTADEIWKSDQIMAANSGYGADFETLRELVRAIEKAHGIEGGAP